MLLGMAKFIALFLQRVTLINLHSSTSISLHPSLFHCSWHVAHILIYFEFGHCSKFHNRKAHPLTSSFYMARWLVIFPWHGHKWQKTQLATYNSENKVPVLMFFSAETWPFYSSPESYFLSKVSQVKTWYLLFKKKQNHKPNPTQSTTN